MGFLSALLLALVLAFGPMAHGIQAGDLGEHISVADGMPLSGKCPDGSGGGDSMAAAACFLHCNNIGSTTVSNVAADAVPTNSANFVAPGFLAGRDDPPDPHPPKRTALS
jgi:hypothetical protein